MADRMVWNSAHRRMQRRVLRTEDLDSWYLSSQRGGDRAGTEKSFIDQRAYATYQVPDFQSTCHGADHELRWHHGESDRDFGLSRLNLFTNRVNDDDFRLTQHPGTYGCAFSGENTRSDAEASSHLVRPPRTDINWNIARIVNKDEPTATRNASFRIHDDKRLGLNGKLHSRRGWQWTLSALEADVTARMLGLWDRCPHKHSSLDGEVARMLLRSTAEFRVWLLQGGHHQTGQKTSAPSQASSSSSGKRFRGRRDGSQQGKQNSGNRSANHRDRAESDDEDRDDEEEEERDKKRPRGSDVTPDSADAHLNLICPFYRRNRVIYEDCLSSQLSLVKDVKQHLRRRHMQPRYCPTCGRTFEGDSTGCDQHIKARLCADTQFEVPDGITLEDLTKLGKRVKRSDSLADQWYTVWDILFPGIPRPKSVFNKGFAADICEELMSFWQHEGPRTAVDFLAAEGGPESFARDHNLDESTLSMMLVQYGGAMLSHLIYKVTHGECPAVSGADSSPSNAESQSDESTQSVSGRSRSSVSTSATTVSLDTHGTTLDMVSGQATTIRPRMTREKSHGSSSDSRAESGGNEINGKQTLRNCAQPHVNSPDQRHLHDQNVSSHMHWCGDDHNLPLPSTFFSTNQDGERPGNIPLGAAADQNWWLSELPSFVDGEPFPAEFLGSDRDFDNVGSGAFEAHDWDFS